MIIEKMPLGCYSANCYILVCEDTKEAVVVDPGGDSDVIMNFIKDKDLQLKYIILTHGHGDHIGGVLDLREVYNIPVLIHENDEELIADPDKNLSTLLPMNDISFKSDRNLKDGDIIDFGKLRLEVIHTPGHSQGCICLKAENNIITGDTLFRGSVGRTDLYGSSSNILESIKNKLLIYDDSTIIYPGHGENSTIGYEIENNPFL
ncbi:beta-lactamase domain-containing protein [Gottschalkia acidurici 9a]|uniref:Beta-lactamase domain-containing protein n=1 Tax=Gottschalkia acidurici (strain ATCC 7906 / DSM 604 / BCRC 14475 / CIP 104303 / KCTC 5404 / NCIMB 10678 / 9a) TaxID=1128398 RepID=K0B199_GOTA9|nr:MBL fold metallo-hydrolase [Gottschalkia acidurici]AFS78740.1 beta-lactamase domain-containing protein [Gottschalkia acidurici 9a]